MNKRHMAIASLAAVFALPGLVLAVEAPAKPGTAGVLEVEFLIDGQYSAKNEMDGIDWRVKRNLKLSYEIYAGNLAQVGTIGNPAHTAEILADSAALSARGQAVAANNADLMASMEAAADACGDDEACMERFAMQMVMQPGKRQQLDQMSKDVQGVTGQTQALQAKMPPRYQLWKGKDNQPLKGGGEAGLEETLHSTTYDPICHETKNICTFDRARKGGHKVDGSAGVLALASPLVEIDTVTDKISLVLPAPILAVKVDEKTAGGVGKAEVPFFGYPGELNEELKIIDASGRQGEKVIKLEHLDRDYEGPVTLTVRWRFRGA